MRKAEAGKISYEGHSGCPNGGCTNHEARNRDFAVKKGYFKTKWNGQPVRRYRCRDCGRSFSSHTRRETYGQHRPDLNEVVLKLYASAMTQRRMAIVLGINRKTVVRKFLFAAYLARKEHQRRIEEGELKTSVAQFDEMESFEHTRLKPLSVAIAVRARTGEILDAQVATMSCKGHLAAVALRKYGWRPDTRNTARRNVLSKIRRCSRPWLTVVSDKHPAYPGLIGNLLPHAAHLALSRTSKPDLSISPYRKNQDDPMFTLNYTAAKIRHDLSRMARKVWVTTKKKERLQAHLDLYIAWNNAYRLRA